jgi:hypothetical protein
MSAMIGRGQSWLWWLAGSLCALVFGRWAGAGELPAPKPVYGMPARPVVSEDDQKKAEGLLAEYLAPVPAPEPPPPAKAEIEKLIKDFASEDAKVREAASGAVVKQGRAALGLLRGALTSKDAEVVERSRMAIGVIENSVRGPQIEEMKKLGAAGQNFVRQKWTEANAAALTAEKAATEAEKAGKADEAEKSKAEAKAARERAGALAGLLRQVAPPVMQARYMARPMVPLAE